MNTITDKYSHFILQIFILQLRGKEKTAQWVNRIAYAVATPCENNTVFVNMRDFNRVGSCDYYKQFITCFKMANTRQTVLAVVKDICEGKSLPDVLADYEIEKPKTLDFDLKFEGGVFDNPWGVETVFGTETIYSNMVCLDDIDNLFKYGDITPEQITKVRADVATELEKQTHLPFTDLYSEHLGNIEIIVQPDREPKGRALVRLCQDKDNGFKQIVEIDASQSQCYDRFYVNYSIWKDGRIIIDELLSQSSVAGKSTVFTETPGNSIDRLEVKVWGEKSGKTVLISRNTVAFIKQILVNTQIVGDRFKANFEWLENMRKTMPVCQQPAIDAASLTERSTSESYVVSVKTEHRPMNKSNRPKIKCNDVFFHAGWNPGSQEQGGLLFLEWFRNKTRNANSLFLQDPYFEDVALYMMATSNAECTFNVLTQSKLTTNTDGTSSFSVDKKSRRGDKILDMIHSYPTLFKDIQLIVWDLNSSNNILHDRYLVIKYEDYHTEAYSLSNSLQGATRKQPILITQIGDDAFEQVKKHIKETFEGSDIVTLYNYSEKAATFTCKNKEVADENYLKRLEEHFKKGDWVRFVCLTLNCCFDNRFCTLSYFLANHDNGGNGDIPYGIADAISDKDKLVARIKDFIINNYEKDYPLGFGGTRGLDLHEKRYVSWIGRTYGEIVNYWNVRELDYVGIDGGSLRVWGQYYAVKLLCRCSVTAFVSTMQILEMTCAKEKGDRAAATCVKMLNAFMNEAFFNVLYGDNVQLLENMLKQNDTFCRALASLLLIKKTRIESFDLKQYQHYFSDLGETATLCMTALGCNPDVAHKKLFHKWLLETLLVKNDKQFVIQCILSFISDSHMLSDKKDILLQVALPICQQGLIKIDEFAAASSDLLYDRTINKDINLFDVLPLALECVGGSLETLIQKAENTFSEYQRKLNSRVVKSDDDLLCIANSMLELRSLLFEVVDRCKSADSSQLDKIKNLQQQVEKALCSIGFQNTRSFYDMCKLPVISY